MNPAIPMKNKVTFIGLFACIYGFPLCGQILPCTPLGRNLIINPGFEQGYYGFTTDFGRGVNNATRCGCATQGWILVTSIFPHVSPSCQIYPAEWSALYGAPNTSTSPDPNHPSNTSLITSGICNVPIPDHTSGTGLFLSIDPDACAGRAYWKQGLQICPNTQYYFSVWVRNISGLPAPTFHFEIDGVPVTPSTSYPAQSWVQTALNWNSGTLDGFVTLALVNDLPGCNENDVAIDDLFLGVCAELVLSGDTLVQYCPGDAGTIARLSGHATGFIQPEYQWQRRAPGAGNWVDVAGATDTLLVIAAPTQSDAGLYRLLAAEQGNINALSCTVFSTNMLLEAYPAYNRIDTVFICTGQEYEGQGVTGQYTSRYTTALGCDSIRTLDLRVRGALRVYVPNIFSPNDDGQNDRIAPELSELDVDFYHWVVYDRWGNRVFESFTPELAWDGQFRGEACESGVYVYRLEMDIRDCQYVQLGGDIMLWR